MRKKEKLYYKIGEACRTLDIQPYVLRYWETEFPFLSPSKSKSGQRVYTSKELDVIRRIKELLYEEGYTIAGAKKKLEAEIEAGGPEISRPAGSGDGAAAKSQAPAQVPEAKVELGKSDPPEAHHAKPLDSAAVQRVETLRRGIEEALRETREILALLDSQSPDP